MRSILGSLVIALLVTACNPVIGSSLSVGDLRYDAIGRTPLQGVGAGFAVEVHHFDDARRSPYLMILGSRRMRGDVAPAQLVATAFKDMFKQQGYSVIGKRGPVVSGAILDWQVERIGSFTMDTAKAQAQFRVIVNDAYMNPIFSSTYSGQAEERSPILSEGHFTDALQAAMTEALLAAASDQRLHSAIHQFFDDPTSGVSQRDQYRVTDPVYPY